MSNKRQRNKRRQWARECRTQAMFENAVRSFRPFGKNSAYESLFGIDWGHKRDYTGTVTFRLNSDSVDREAKPPSYEVRMTSKPMITAEMVDWPDIPDLQRRLNKLQDQVHDHMNQMLAEACAMPPELLGTPRPWTSAEIAEMREADYHRRMVEELKWRVKE